MIEKNVHKQELIENEWSKGKICAPVCSKMQQSEQPDIKSSMTYLPEEHRFRPIKMRTKQKKCIRKLAKAGERENIKYFKQKESRHNEMRGESSSRDSACMQQNSAHHPEDVLFCKSAQ